MRRRPGLPQVRIDMTPMVDVTFLVLVFFLVTSKFTSMGGSMDSALPRSSSTGCHIHNDACGCVYTLDLLVTVDDPGRLVETAPREFERQGRRLLYRSGSWEFRSLDALRPYFDKWNAPVTPVSVDLREGTTYEDAIGLLDLIHEYGFAEVAFAGTAETDW